MTDYGRFFMSKKDLVRFEVVEAFRGGKLTRQEASLRLEVSERQVSRLAAKCRSEGLRGLLHKNSGSVPPNKLKKEISTLYLDLYVKKYYDFNFRHALEWIHHHEQIPVADQISYETFRLLCRKANLGKVKARKHSKSRVQRERCISEGAVLQMDGSSHAWRGSEKSTLVALIDDATSRIPAAQFTESETTWACINVLREVVRHQGVPGIIITDQAGRAGGNTLKRPSFSQFGRVCDELGIILVRTSTPEAKGRIERLFRTAQDRLIPELRINEIKSRLDANRYLHQCFIPAWNEQFTVQPTSNISRYRPVSKHIDLEQVFCMKHSRQAARDQSVHFEGKQYRILNREWGSLWKKNIPINESENGSLRFFLGAQELDHEEITKNKRNWLKRPA